MRREDLRRRGQSTGNPTVVRGNVTDQHTPPQTGPGTGTRSPQWDFEFTIAPAAIVTRSDRPDFTGGNTVNPPNGTHVTTGNPLTGGADKKWDVSRRMRVKALSPNVATAWYDDPGGTIYDNLPSASIIQENYPANTVMGNDDTATSDENNIPNAQAKVSSSDRPTCPVLRNAGGNVGNLVEYRLQFGEFLRLEIAGNWYRVSDYYDWRFHGKLIKVNTEVKTGANGICNTAAAGDDVQVIAQNQGEPNTTVITPGNNSTLDTTAGGDDQVVGNTITSGADGIANTTAQADDVQVIVVGNGEANSVCITRGANDKGDSTPGGDDVADSPWWVDNGSVSDSSNNGW